MGSQFACALDFNGEIVSMRQTPINEIHNQQVLDLIPRSSRNIIEIGCSSGAMAREFKNLEPGCHYTGIEIDSDYAERAKRYCSKVMVLDIEQADAEFWNLAKQYDCWVFADVLEHLRNPWAVLKQIREVLPDNGAVVACIPNVQNWLVTLNLSKGNFRYQDMGLFDRTHIRWFTRETMFELFDQGGFVVNKAVSRIFNQPDECILAAIGHLAELAGGDRKQAMEDAIPLQYVFQAIPK